MRVLVTGAGGFIGSHIARYLNANGFDVTGTCHTSIVKAEYDLVRLDLSTAIPDIGTFDVIVHAAGSLPQNKCEYKEFKHNNIDSMENLLVYAKQYGIKKFIYLSSISVYGEFRRAVVTEKTDRVNPDAYGQTKYVAECLLRSEKNIKGISLRMPGVLGVGCRRVWLSNTIEKFIKNEDVKIYSPNFQTRNFVWLEDLTKFICKLIHADTWKYDVVNLACHERVTVRELVHEIKRLTNSKSNIIIDDSIRLPFCIDDTRALDMGYESISPLDIVSKILSSGGLCDE